MNKIKLFILYSSVSSALSSESWGASWIQKTEKKTRKNTELRARLIARRIIWFMIEKFPRGEREKRKSKLKHSNSQRKKKLRETRKRRTKCPIYWLLSSARTALYIVQRHVIPVPSSPLFPFHSDIGADREYFSRKIEQNVTVIALSAPWKASLSCHRIAALFGCAWIWPPTEKL